MKKTLLTLTAAILMSMSLVGCGGEAPADNSTDKASPTEVTSVQKDKQDTSKETEIKSDETEKTAADGTSSTEDSNNTEKDSE